MQVTSNAARRDASVARMATLFPTGPLVSDVGDLADVERRNAVAERSTVERAADQGAKLRRSKGPANGERAVGDVHGRQDQRRGHPKEHQRNAAADEVEDDEPAAAPADVADEIDE